MEKDYDEFVQRMGSFEMKLGEEQDMLDEIIEHFGVKGMKWGVRKAKKSGVSPSKGAKQLTAMEKSGSLKTKAGRKAYGDLEDSIDYSRPKKPKGKSLNEKLGDWSRKEGQKNINRSVKNARARKAKFAKLKAVTSMTLKNASKMLNTAVDLNDAVEEYKGASKVLDATPNSLKMEVASILYNSNKKN